jgi:uncharacterized HAD superfamily protein
LCKEQNEWWDYANAKPIPEIIEKINKLYENGHTIVIHTARFKEDVEVTRRWLKFHRVRYHRLITEKFRADIYVDSNAKRPEEL